MRWRVRHLGTTSARYGTDEKLIDVFETLVAFTENENNWSLNDQLNFSRSLQEQDLYNPTITSEPKLQKNARQISSMFEQLGFVDNERQITQLGNKVLNEHTLNETLPIIKESQAAFLISIFNFIDGDGIKIFRKFINDISDSRSMTKRQFVNEYLIVNPMTEQELDDEINSVLPIQSFENFKSLVHHQKGDTFNIKYYNFYKNALDFEGDSILLWNQISNITTDGKFTSALKNIIFGTSTKRNITIPIIEINSLTILKAILNAKLKALTLEYEDLAYRIFRATGLFYIEADNITISEDFAEIVNELGLSDINEVNNIHEMFSGDISTIDSGEFENVQEQLVSSRSHIFERYLDEHLTKDVVINFLSDMQRLDWTNIGNFFENSSTNPTYAEFLVSVAFHYLSNRKTNFIESWNGQIRADNKPFRHAGAGVPDASFKINQKIYLIETTIQTGFQQMANEIGPISEHLLDTVNNTKEAHLFAKRISPRAIRQAEIQRASDVFIYTHKFEIIKNLLQSTSSMNEMLEELAHV